jgi:hypothetical protein
MDYGLIIKFHGLYRLSIFFVYSYYITMRKFGIGDPVRTWKSLSVWFTQSDTNKYESMLEDLFVDSPHFLGETMNLSHNPTCTSEIITRENRLLL